MCGVEGKARVVVASRGVRVEIRAVEGGQTTIGAVRLPASAMCVLMGESTRSISDKNS
jgi:hypothetical protein